MAHKKKGAHEPLFNNPVKLVIHISLLNVNGALFYCPFSKKRAPNVSLVLILNKA